MPSAITTSVHASLPKSRLGHSLRRFRLLPTGLISEWNVRLSLLTSALGALASSIAHGNLFTIYIHDLYGDNTSVGLTESISGLMALVTAWPVGVAVDRISRTRLLRGCAVLGLLAAVTGLVAVGWGPTAAIGPDGSRQPPSKAFTAVLLFSLGCWGVFFNTATSAWLALFADSVPEGYLRRQVFAIKSQVTFLSLSAGPCVALLLSLCLGNTWGLRQTAASLMPGFLVMIPLSMLLLLFEDVDPALARDSESGHLHSVNYAESATAVDQKKSSAIPYLLLCAELVTSIGAGMTVKFFSLWFKSAFNFSPVGLNALQVVGPIAIAGAVQILQATIKRSPFGPVVSVLAFWVTSVIVLLAMTKVSDWRVLVVLHLVRTALANSKEPIARAILADAVPSSRRGRWNAIHSMTGMTWTGSAALGGVLCDRYGYGQTFIFTAILYLIATCFWIPLCWLVPRDGPPPKAEESKSS